MTGSRSSFCFKCVSVIFLADEPKVERLRDYFFFRLFFFLSRLDNCTSLIMDVQAHAAVRVKESPIASDNYVDD